MGCAQSQQAALHAVAGNDVVSDILQAFLAENDFSKCIVRMQTCRDTPIESVYEIDYQHELGRGAGGIVREAVHLVTGDHFAVKCLEKKRVNNNNNNNNNNSIDDEDGLQALRNEIALMCEIDHPNIVRIREVYESEDMLYIVQELCTGGELWDRLDQVGHFSEAECAKMIKTMASAISYLHEHGICHRDLKLENWLYSTTGELVLIDFGLSKHFENGQPLNEMVGTPYTVAPEILQKTGYNQMVDVWALGVIGYLLLCGETPFGGLDGEGREEITRRITEGVLNFEPKAVWNSVSESAQDFVQSLLTIDPNQRPNAKQIQRHPWIVHEQPRSNVLLKPATVKALLGFQELSDFEKLQSEILSFTLLPEQCAELLQEFDKLDTEGDGEVSLVALQKAVSPTVSVEALEAAYDAIKLRKDAPGIQWHEFLAAMISLANVDERNMRLAFDRLDCGGKGYLTWRDLHQFCRMSPKFQNCCALQSGQINFTEFKRVHSCHCLEAAGGGGVRGVQW